MTRVDLNTGNIRSSIEGDDLVIRINTKQNCGPSSTGKNILVANSKGFQSLAGGYRVSLSAIPPKA